MSSVPPCRPGLPFVSPGLFIAAFFFAAGICWAQIQEPAPAFLQGAILLLLTFLFVLHKLHLNPHKAFCRFLLALLFLLLGLHNAATFSGPPTDPSHIYNLVDRQQTVLLEGTLHEYPAVLGSSTGPKTRLLVAAKRIYRPAGVDSAPQGFFKASGLVLLNLKGTVPHGLVPGSVLLARANVSRVSTYSTPGAFNYKKYLARRNIFIRGWIRSSGNMVQLNREDATAFPLRYLPERIRHGIAAFLDRTLSQPTRGLYKAILIGDRSDVPAEVLENFTGAGCIHILAISGMHMGLLALLLTGLATWILKRSEWSSSWRFSLTCRATS
jgi:competence protein ComEC